MSATAKTFLVGGLGLLFALFVGVLLGNDSLVLPIGIACAGPALLIYLMFFRNIRIEALLLGFLVFGYMVGNRGFAQIGVGGANSPLFFGEVILAVCVALLVLRFTTTREQIIPPTPLGWAIFGFVVAGGIRLYLDTIAHVNGVPAMLAIRDSAAVYYALFFFIAYRLGKDAPSRRFLFRSIILAAIVLLPVAALQYAVPDFLYRFSWHGTPIIYQKGDLVASFLAITSYFFFLNHARGAARLWLSLLSIGSLGLMLIFMSRAAWLGFGAAGVLLVIARRPHFLLYQAAMGAVGLLCLALLKIADVESGGGYLSRFSDKLLSVTDVSGTGTYRGTVGEMSADNNKFRTVWWQSVFDDTMAKAPVFGLGFGYDLAAGFLRNYYGNSGQSDFTTRSPHSIWLTMLGRMGIIGLLAFTSVVILVLHGAFSAALRVARGRAPPESLAVWCAVVILLGAASFGVVLEGPMGGVLFWSFLGLAASQKATAPLPKLVTSNERPSNQPLLASAGRSGLAGSRA